MSPAHRLRCLVFVQGGRRWAVPVPGVVEVLREPRLHPVPSPAEDAVGMLLHDGRALAALVLEGDYSADFNYAVVVGTSEDRVALLTDDAGNLENLDAEKLSGLEKGLREEIHPAVLRLWRDEDIEIAVLDHRRLCSLRR